MADQPIAPINPNLTGQKEAVAGSSGIVFTSTDRKLIKERAGEIDKTMSFKDVMAQGIAHKVENEETTVEPGQEVNIQELETRKREHERMLSNAPAKIIHDKVEMLKGKEGDLPKPPKDMAKQNEGPVKEDMETVEIGKKTAQIVRELNLKPDDIVDKFHLDEKDLYELVFRIKDLHLKRLLTNNKQEYMQLTDVIKNDTLAAAKPEAKEWLNKRLDNLTLSSAQYKLKLLDSLKTMGLSDEQRESVNWLDATIKKYSSGKD